MAVGKFVPALNSSNDNNVIICDDSDIVDDSNNTIESETAKSETKIHPYNY